MSSTTIAQLAGYRGWSFAERLRSLRAPWRSFRRRLVHKPGSTLAITAATLLSGAILANAVAFQTERHPSPMFTSLDPVTRTAAATAPAAAPPLPPARPREERQKAETGTQQAKARNRDEPQRSTSTSAKDQLAAVLSESAETTSALAQPEIPAGRVLQIQKALNKAGFGPLKEDGAFGSGTRRALERFESEKKLVVRGEPNGKVLKELAKVSGIAVN